ncbi:UNKNOWN [Stylonychia lemnae]|uniref:Transmembrane protein n=1 Tax=Stylonychia lemnae TaxID=5949 RepID=A0A078ACS3_STYLE|nr:UNKNOWN [Stylonychia lemnae]|eukprot:CDW79984.1 UNKNOWN [Stylonychia lemnae]
MKQPANTKQNIYYEGKTQEELVNQCFDFSKSAVPSYISDEKLNSARIMILIPSLLTFFAALSILDTVRLFLYFTDWGMHITNISIILTILASSSDKCKSSLRFREFSGYLTELALISQFIIITIYWTTIHIKVIEYTEELAKTDPNHAYYYYQLMIYKHFLPGLCALLNVIISEIIFVPYHLKYMIVYGMVYCLVNYTCTKILGGPLYHFLTWEDYWSIVICVGITIPNALVYYVFCKIIRFLRLKPLNIDKID